MIEGFSRSSPSSAVSNVMSELSTTPGKREASVRSQSSPPSVFGIPQPDLKAADPQSPRSEYVSRHINVEAKSMTGQLTNELLSRFHTVSAISEIRDLEIARFKIGLDNIQKDILLKLKAQKSFKRSHKSVVKDMTCQANELISRTLDVFKSKYLICPPEHFGTVLKKQAESYITNINYVSCLHYGDQRLDRIIDKVSRNKKSLEKTELVSAKKDYSRLLQDYTRQFMQQNDSYRKISLSKTEKQIAVEKTFCYQVEHNEIQGVIDSIALRDLKSEPADTYFNGNNKCVDCFGHSVIDYAAYHGRLDFIKRFVAAGALAYSNNSVGQGRRFQPIHWAAKAGHDQVVGYLCEYYIEHSKEKYISAKGGNLEYTPLHLALKNKRLEASRVLIQHSADVNAVALDGLTPVLIASTIFPQALKPLCARSQVSKYAESQLDRDKVDAAMDIALKNHDYHAIRILASCSTISTARFLTLLDNATTDDDRKTIITEVFYRRMRWGMEERIQRELGMATQGSGRPSPRIKIGSAASNREFIERQASLLVSECLETIKEDWVKNAEGIVKTPGRLTRYLSVSPPRDSRNDHSASWVQATPE